jgi:hypothetical protein
MSQEPKKYFVRRTSSWWRFWDKEFTIFSRGVYIRATTGDPVPLRIFASKEHAERECAKENTFWEHKYR